MSEDFLAFAILIAAFLLWGLSVPQIDERNIDHLGIVSALTPMSFLGMGLMNVGFVLLVRREHSPDWLKLAYVLVLILMLAHVLFVRLHLPGPHWISAELYGMGSLLLVHPARVE